MRRLPGILLLTGAALVVIAALLVSGLRIALPHLDAWRPEILNKIESATGMPVEASQLSASWQNFGPTLEAHDIRAELKDGGEFSVKRVTLALDVWQSLLHMRWQFRDLTFWQLRFRTNTPITSGGSDDSLEASHISDLFLRQFDHFDLRDGEVGFLTPSVSVPSWRSTTHLAERSTSTPCGRPGKPLQPYRTARRDAGAHGFAR